MKKGWETKKLGNVLEKTETVNPLQSPNAELDYIFEGDNLLVSEDGANLLARSTPIAFSVSGKYWVNNHAHILHFENMATQRFADLYLESIRLDDYITREL